MRTARGARLPAGSTPIGRRAPLHKGRALHALLLVLPALLLLGVRPALASGGHPHFHDGHTLDWSHDLDSARHRARSEHKFIFVELGKPGCGNCRDLISNILPTDGYKQRLARITVGLAVDARFPDPTVQRIFQRWIPAAQLRTLPWAGFLDYEGRWICGWGGRISPAQYEAFLARAEHVHGVATRKRERRERGGPLADADGPDADERGFDEEQPSALADAFGERAVPQDPAHPVEGPDEERKVLLSSLTGEGICLGGTCGSPGSRQCGPGGCAAPDGLLAAPSEGSAGARLADLPGSEAPAALRTWSTDDVLAGPFGRTNYVAPAPGPAAIDAPAAPPGGPALLDTAPRRTAAAPTAPVAPGALPPPDVRRVPLSPSRRAHPDEPARAPVAGAEAEALLYGSPDGDQPANMPSRTPRGRVVDDAPAARIPGSVRAVRVAVPAERSAAAKWADVRLEQAVVDARSGRLDEARSGLDEVIERLGDEALAEDARRGCAALKDLAEIRLMSSASPIRSFLMDKAHGDYRGSRWAPLFQ